jgi:hypothetical protein
LSEFSKGDILDQPIRSAQIGRIQQIILILVALQPNLALILTRIMQIGAAVVSNSKFSLKIRNAKTKVASQPMPREEGGASSNEN